MSAGPPSSAASPGSSTRPPRKRRWLALAVLGAYVIAVAAGAIYTDYVRPLPDPTKPVKGLRWWITPREQNAFMRMPVITGQLNSMDVSRDGRIIVLVGDENYLLTSPDAGRTWVRGTTTANQLPTVPLKPSGAFNFSFGLTGTAQALDKDPKGFAPPDDADSKRPRSDVKGQTSAPPDAKRSQADSKRPAVSEEQPPPKKSPEVVDQKDRAANEAPHTPFGKRKLFGVSIVDDRTYVAVGERGVILRSNDAGKTWTLPAAPTSQTLRSIACAQRICMAAGAQGTLLHSIDAGATWRDATLAGVSDLDAVTHIDGDRWLTVGSGSVHSLDANARLVRTVSTVTWSAIDAWDKYEGAAIAFDRDHTTGAIVIGGTASGFLLRTRDGGNSWLGVQRSRIEPLHSALFDVAGRLLAIGSSPAGISWTDDLGESWNVKPLSVPSVRGGPSRGQLAMSDAGDVFVLAPNDALFRRSPDGRWERLAVGGYDGLWDLEMMPSGRGLIVGTQGVVLATDDGGETWEPRDSGVESDLNSVAFADDRLAIAVNYTSPTEGAVIRTSDAGESWHRVDTSPPAGFGALRFAEPNHVFLQSLYDMFESTDGGDSWNRREAMSWTKKLGFADGRNGVRTTFDSTFFNATAPEVSDTYGTTDAGRTWQKLDDVQVAWAEIDGRTRYSLFSDDGRTPVAFPGSVPLATNAVEVLRKAREAAWNDRGVGLVISSAPDSLLRTTNNGETWSSIANPTNVPLESIRFAGRTRAVAFAQGRVAVSDDAGETFRLVAYRRYPSPWLWLSSLLLVAGVLVYARSSINAPAVEVGPPSIADAAASDRPIQWWDPDHAGLRDIALGLSRFLRNRKTDPPLTIAVTGEWGTGKSSLMNLLRHDLERYGYKPVWFNAWHHQSGENLLGSLLANIHAQGVPSFFSLAGLDFRVSLTAIRGRRLWLQACVILVLFAVVGFSYPVLKEKWFPLWASLSKLGEGDSSNLGAATGLFGFALAVVWQLAGVVRMVSAFGLQPGKLIAAVASTSQDESARHQSGARYRFAREFEDFTRALEPRPLVVFIDDLDRCRAPNVVETLEAVNFLVSSGRCIVVLGMARHWVETCVGLAFKELADAHIEAARVNAKDGSSEQQLFARHYLEKLINIEIRVPQLSDAAASAILQGAPPSAPHHDLRYALGTFLLRGFRWLMVVAAACAIAAVGHWIAQSFASTAAPHVTELSGAAAAAPARVPTANTPSVTTPPPKPAGSFEIARVEPARAQTSTAWYWSGGALAMLGMVALALLALFARREARTDDSPAFREALAILQPFILLGGTSPRSLKRFINQLRYLAMRSRLTPDTSASYERITKRIRGFFGRNTPEVPSLAPPQHEQLLTEELLVALAALHRCSDGWLHALVVREECGDLTAFFQRELADRVRHQGERAAVIARLSNAVSDFNRAFLGSALFANATLDRNRVQAFSALMALAQAPAQTTKIGSIASAAVPATTTSDQVF